MVSWPNVDVCGKGVVNVYWFPQHTEFELTASGLEADCSVWILTIWYER
jgi:hypothetical protein